jgi:hypothetical protein
MSDSESRDPESRDAQSRAPRIRPLSERANKVTVADFAKVPGRVPGFGDWFESLPDILGAKQLKELVRTGSASNATAVSSASRWGRTCSKWGCNRC